MSTINSQDLGLIEELKKGVEQVSGLVSPENWTQKDYDFLVYFIEERSGVRISLSTLKRIWKNENNRLPHIATLDALSQVAFQKNWLSLKADLASKQAPTIPEKTKKNKKVVRLSAIAMVIVLLGFFGFNYFNATTKAIIKTDGVHFSARTSVDGKVPNSVVFDYDISAIKAERFYLQQSWDPRRRVEIFKENKTQTDIYYEPGLYNAKLIADSTVLAQIPVHIKTNDWFIPIVITAKFTV